MQLATLAPLAVLFALGLGASAPATAQALLPVPPDSPPLGAPPFITPPVVDPPVDAPPLGLPVGGPIIDHGMRPDEIAVLVEHPLAEAFDLPGPMLSFSFSPGEGPPVVPTVIVPGGIVPEPSLLGLLAIALLGGLALRPRSRRSTR
jgi:hypothetical protein